ncbi:DUF6283 family protein [Paraburkholderia phenoliruptrix]|uniref:DUF6283 family protein n=1 Tax=Paraburkholderia phenoliruptrix TaxID=252970 RepID=UPI0039B365B9
MALAKNLSATCPDNRGMGPDFGASVFACYQSKSGEEFACAGWLAAVGHCHARMRLAVALKRLDATALEPGSDWPALHENYQQVLDNPRRSCATGAILC